MRTAIFGSTARRVPVVGQGTWNLERDDRRGALAALERGIDLGMTHLDTAEMYGSGRVEELLRPVVTRRRDDVFLVSKVLPSHASREGTIAACEASLARLGTERLDVYLLHWESHHLLEETVAAFHRLADDGKIAAWGVSNFDARQLQEAVALGGDRPPACNQVLYHLGSRAIEHTVLPACNDHGVALVGYSPFGSGSFPSPASPGGRVLAKVAAAHGATVHQVALAFLLRQPGTFVIPKAARVDHVQENAAAGDLVLDDGEVERIDRAFPRGPEPGTLPVI